MRETKVTINGVEKNLKKLVDSFNELGHKLNYDSLNTIKNRAKRAGNTSFKYKFLSFEETNNGLECKII